MKLSDFIAQFLKGQGVTHVFGVTGGAIVHVFDSIERTTDMRVVFTHHEQAAAFAASAYARVRNDLGVVCITTGPGGTNTLTGLCAAWLDSIPCLFISGQARLSHTTHNKPIRQLGSQQFDIVPVVSHMTKYAVMIDDPQRIKYELQKAVYIARSGRPGPVWVDIPLDIQWASVEPKTLRSFDGANAEKRLPNIFSDDSIKSCLKLLQEARRPVILAGYGIRLAHAEKEFKQLINAFKIPFLSTWNASDIVATDHALYTGRPGIFGQRGANLAMQNCDLLLGIGSHLSIPLTGTNFEAFAPGAKRILVDVDPVELDHRTVRVDLAICCDAKVFLKEMLKRSAEYRLASLALWRKKCADFKARYNILPPEWYRQKKYVHPYVFVDVLSDALNPNDLVVVDGGGTIAQVAFQTFRVKENQRFMIDTGTTSMGSGLPESVGASFGRNGGRTVCLCGDGSMQFNVQELQTIVHHRLPVKIFLLINKGYLSIRHTQQGFLGGHFIGSCEKGGLSLPDYQKIAKAYGIKTVRIKNHKELKQKIRQVLKTPGPVVCELLVDPKQEVSPRQGFDKMPDGTFRARPLEDMFPFLSREEFKENMIGSL